jgi:hypothetical protein
MNLEDYFLVCKIEAPQDLRNIKKATILEDDGPKEIELTNEHRFLFISPYSTKELNLEGINLFKYFLILDRKENKIRIYRRFFEMIYK